MLRSLLKISGIIFLILMDLEGLCKYQKSSLDLAKRSLLQREKEYIRNQPLSEDLSAFIERYQRRSEKRLKRSQNLEENLYIIQNGHLVPVKTAKAKASKRSDIEEHDHSADRFTVVPLVIPITNKNKDKVKTRTLEEAESIPLLEAEQPVALQQAEQNTVENAESSGNDTEAATDESKVLHRILEDVEGLMQWKHDGNKKEGVICNINGSWVSDAAGMRLDICYENATRKKFRIDVTERTPPKEDGFLCDGDWSVFGEIPFLHSGLVIVLAVHQKDRHLATFIGECRVCEGIDAVTGTWLLGRSSRDCKDQKASHKIFSDIWRREQGHTLRKKHLEQLGYKIKDDD